MAFLLLLIIINILNKDEESMVFKAPIWILSFILFSTSLLASEYKPDSGAVKNYLEKSAYHHLANTITDESVQQELITLLNSLGKKEFQLLVSPNEADFITKNIKDLACGCNAMVVSLSHLNEDLLSHVLLENNKLKVNKELENLNKEALDLDNSPYLKAALSFYMEFKPQLKLNKAISAGLPNKNVTPTTNEELAIKIANHLSNQDIYLSEKLVKIFSLKAQSTNLNDFLNELNKSKNLKSEFIKLNESDKVEEDKAEKIKAEPSFFIKFSEE